MRTIKVDNVMHLTTTERTVLINAQFELDAIMNELKDIDFTGPAMDIQYIINKLEDCLKRRSHAKL